MERCYRKIRSRVIVFLGAILFCVALSALIQDVNDADVPDDNSVVQILVDNSYAVKEFAQSLFDEYMAAQGIVDYSIEQIAYGFDTSEVSESVYMVGYLYEVDGMSEKYGYRITIDEGGNFSLLDEGAEIADFVFGG